MVDGLGFRGRDTLVVSSANKQQGTRDLPSFGPLEGNTLHAACLILIDDDYKFAEIGNGGEMQSRLGLIACVLRSPDPRAPLPAFIVEAGSRVRDRVGYRVKVTLGVS